MFWNRKKRSNNKSLPILNKTDYGRIVVSYVVLMHGEEFKKLSREYNKWGFVDYLTYLQYLTFLSQKILETRYAPEDVDLIIDACISGIVDGIDIILPNKKQDMKNVMKKQYQLLIEYADMDIGSEHGLHALVKMFLDDIETDDSFNYRHTFFSDFALYISHHTDTILNSGITVV